MIANAAGGMPAAFLYVQCLFYERNKKILAISVHFCYNVNVLCKGLSRPM